MNKTITLISLAFILLTLTACGSIAQAAPLPTKTIHPTVVPQPTTIQDPLLLEGWNILYAKTEPVQLWDGRIISGHELAEYVLEYAIPIVWDSADFCDGNSCSLRYCKGDVCSYYDDSQPGVRPIFINPSIQTETETQTSHLIDNLAHEIYHRTQPFGLAPDSLYEEFSAYYLGARISGVSWANFDDYNPLQSACLVKWFYDTRLLAGYKQFNTYSPSMIPSVDTTTTICAPDTTSSASTISDHPITCTLGPDGTTDCQFPPAPTPAPEYRLECVTYPSGLKGCKTVWLNQESNTQATDSTP